MFARASLLALLTPSLFALAACSGSDAAPAPTPAPPPTPEATQTGTVIDFATHKPVAGATLSIGSESVTTDASGHYSFRVQPGTPFTQSLSAPGYASLFLQQRTIDGDVADGAVSIVGESTAQLFRSALAGYDESLGSLSIGVVPQSTCASAEGATVTIAPAGAAIARYFVAGLPSAQRTSVMEGQLPSVVFYNVKPGVPLTITVKHPTCKQSPFPVKVGNVEFSSTVGIEAGDATTYASVFLE